jgi:hypothetical protein
MALVVLVFPLDILVSPENSQVRLHGFQNNLESFIRLRKTSTFPIVLLLHKVDIFRSHLVQRPLEHILHEYTGGSAPDLATSLWLRRSDGQWVSTRLETRDH